MTTGSLRLPKSTPSNSPASFAGSGEGSPCTAVASATANTNARRRSGGRRIFPYRRVDVVEQTHVLRADLDFHAASGELDRLPADGDQGRRGDHVALAIVGGLGGLELEIVEPHRHGPAEREGTELASVEGDPPFGAGHVSFALAILEKESHARLDHHDLAVLLEILRILGGH